jgi:cyclophilin family peptidyl-prolyl cis-trans isomerase
MITTRYTTLSFLFFLQILPSQAIAEPFIDIKTNLGIIQVELSPKKAPITVANFLKHVDNKFYDNRLFHRVIKDFIIQAGESNTKLDQVKQDTADLIPIDLEDTNLTGLTNQRGSIAMARKNSPNTAIAQFFINVVDNDFLDFSSEASPGYAVFGQVTEGMDVVDAIQHVTTGSNDLPKKPVTIESIRRHQIEESIPVVITPEKPETPTLPAVTKSQLSFDSVQSSYVVGETVSIILNESEDQRKEKVDLWIAVQLPNDEFLYLSKKDTLSPTPVLFKSSVKIDDHFFHALDFTVPEGLLGLYTFYAIFNQAGEGIDDLDAFLRSNIAAIDVSLVTSEDNK